MEDILVPLGLWVMIAVIVVANVWGGVQNKRELNETLRRAVDSGQTLDPVTISALLKPMRAWTHDLRSGIIFTALGVGFAACGVFFDHGGDGGIMHGSSENGEIMIDAGGSGFYILAAILGSLGIGLIIAALIRRDRKAP
jgi:hypothetical protein